MNELNNKLTPKEQYDFKKRGKDKAKGRKLRREKISAAPKKIGRYVLYISIIVGVIGGIVWLISLNPDLPPITAQSHSEGSPSAHIITTAIPDAIQRHMLEHSDGRGEPGIIIQYNCDDYECEEGVIEQLNSLVSKYPENVYLAPNNYDGKIILTKIGRREILDKYDEQVIRDFIE